MKTMWFGVAFLVLATSVSAQVVVPTLQELRPLYPTPMSKAQIAELLSRAAAQHPGWRLLRKESGNNCPTPSGMHVSCDWLVDTSINWGYDVLRDSDNTAVVQVTGDGAIAPGTDLVLPWDVITPQPGPTPIPTPAPLPTVDLSQAILNAIADVRAAQERIFADETNQHTNQVVSLKASIDNPGWFSTVFGNKYVQMILAGAGTCAATQCWSPKK